MNVFHKVTLHSLKKNKTRTIVTIIGIILSAAMICAVTTLVTSVQNYLLESAISSRGDWHSSVKNVDAELYNEIKGSDEVSGTTYNQILGYAKIESGNEFKPYLYVLGGEKSSFFDMMSIHLVSGAYPKNTSEIIIPDHVMSNGGLKYKVGDTITLELGNRMLDGFVMTQNNPCYEWNEAENKDVHNGEVIEVRETRTYTIVGIYKRPSFEEYTAPGYTALTVSDNKFDESARFDVYFKMQKPSEVYNFMEKLQISGTQNNDVLMYMGISQYGNFTDVLISLSVIVIALIMFGSVSLIYNAFAISVSERTKQFGLLSSVGATKKQLRKMVFFEAFAVSAIGIPLGILVGIGGIGTTLLLLGDKFTSMMNSYNEPMRLCVSWGSILIAAVVALITVLISAWIPSKRATKVSAVEAIRQNADIKVKKKQTKTSKLTYKLFGLPGVIANKHYKRNKKKYRTTVVSLFMSIVLFVSTAAFSDYLMGSVMGGFSANEFELHYQAHSEHLNETDYESLLQILISDKDITHGACVQSSSFHGEIKTDYVTDELIDVARDDENGKETIVGFWYFVNDSEFDLLLTEYNLEKAKYYDKENPLAIAVDKSTWFDGEKEKYVTIDTLKGDQSEIECTVRKNIDGYVYTGSVNKDGKEFFVYENPKDSTDKLEIPYEEAFVNYTLKSEKTITEYPFFMDRSLSAHIHMIYPMSMYENVLPKELQSEQLYDYYLQSEDHDASCQNLKTTLLENGFDPKYMVDVAENEETVRNTVLIIQVFAYGFIVLISLIAAANVFNTISTNISLRRREFAMLKSVGMTQKGFNKMMNFECLLYGSKALILGLPVSAGITYLIYKATSGGFESTYHLPWGAIGIAVLSVFLVVFVTMLYSMSKIKKENPIDALKNENL